MFENYLLFRTERGSDVYRSTGLPAHYICGECHDKGKGNFKLFNQGMLHICPACDEKYEITPVQKISRKSVL